MTGMLYQFPEAGKKTYGGGFYFHLDREPDKEGKSHFQNGALLQNLCEYNYHSWEPGFATIQLQSSIDDPWGELPVRTVVGGAYSSNDLMVHKLNLCEELDADVLAPYLLTARYEMCIRDRSKSYPDQEGSYDYQYSNLCSVYDTETFYGRRILILWIECTQ